jgi:hypothetical protein
MNSYSSIIEFLENLYGRVLIIGLIHGIGGFL